MRMRGSGKAAAPAAILLAAFLGAVCVLGACGCDRQRGSGAGGPEQRDLDAIAALTRGFVEAHNEGDADRLAGLFADDAVIAPDDDPTIEGRDAIADYLDDLLRDYPATAEFEVREVRVAGDWAFERIDVNLLETDPATGEEVETWTRHLWILERQPDGGWKIARLIDNVEPPGDEDQETDGRGEARDA